MKRLCVTLLFCLPLVVGCPRTQTLTKLTNSVTKRSEISVPMSKNESEGADEFVIDADDSMKRRIAQVLSEMESGHGGTLVCDPEDSAIDSSAFVERYLAKFADPTNLKKYDYRFERLLSRVYQFPKALDDPRLDNTIWTAYQKLGNKYSGETEYIVGDTSYTLDSARNLMWTYLNIHAERILLSESRRLFWMDRLLSPSDETQQLTRYFAVLSLIAATQIATPELTVWDVDSNTEIPSGKHGLKWFSDKTSTEWITWGFDPETLLAPRIDNISSGRWEWSNAVDQESWSKKRTRFKVGHYNSVGQRKIMYAFNLPTQLADDGIFFFPYMNQVHIWHKQEFYSGVLRMAQLSGFIDETLYADYTNQLGLNRIEITARFEPE